MARYLLFLFFLWPTITSSEDADEKCFDYKTYFWKHLATKTPYRYVGNNNDTQISYEGCSPHRMWVVVRHGTRYPGTKFINKMRERLPPIRDAIGHSVKNKKAILCSSHIQNITQWTPQVDLADQKRLTHEGEDEMIELAERIQNRFPSLIKLDYSNSSFYFRTTATDRTIQSKYYFTIGLFGRRVAHHVWSPEPVYKDPILRFYKVCSKWIDEVDKNPKASKQYETFKKSDLAKSVLQNIANRLGLKDNFSFDDLEIIYLTCTFESAWNRFAPSPWCSVFTEEEMKVMEFSRDLKHYWKDGYGHDINFKQACPMMQDMLQHFQADSGPTASFYFTHSGTILKLLAHLGLYYDEFKLTHDKFTRPRLWKMSHIDAFGSNIAFVSFKCGDELKLLTLHQERFVKLPGCPNEGLCSFKKLMKTYKESFYNCHFSDLCDVKT